MECRVITWKSGEEHRRAKPHASDTPTEVSGLTRHRVLKIVRITNPLEVNGSSPATKPTSIERYRECRIWHGPQIETKPTRSRSRETSPQPTRRRSRETSDQLVSEVVRLRIPSIPRDAPCLRPKSDDLGDRKWNRGRLSFLVRKKLNDDELLAKTSFL